MPKRLITKEAMKIDRRSWPPLYRLAERFDVTITALTVRLKQLDLLYIDDQKRLYESMHRLPARGCSSRRIFCIVVLS